MATHYTPILTGASATAAMFNSRLQELDNALLALTNDERLFINVRAPRFGAVGNGVTDDTAAIQAAIDEATAVTYGSGTVTRGATIYFPPGIYRISSTLAGIGQGVRLLGATRTMGSAYWGASAIKGTMTNGTYLFDLGSSTNSDVTIEKLTLAGSVGATSGANKSNHCIYAGSIAKFTGIDLNIHGWGGSAIRFDAGVDNRFAGIQATGCLFGYLDLTENAGVIQLASVETFGYDCNWNAPPGVNVHSAVRSGYCHAALFTGSLQHWHQTTFAFGERGVLVAASTSYHNFSRCRFENNQSEGLEFNGAKSRISDCIFSDNSLDTDGAYAACIIGRGGGIQGYDNTWTGCRVNANGISGPYTHSYGFQVQSGNGTGLGSLNTFSNISGSGYTYAMFDHTGVGAIDVSPVNVLNQYSVAGGGTATINAQAGNKWKVTCTGATATIAAPTYPIRGMGVSLEILNSSGGGLTVTFNAVFKHAGYTNPANGKRRTARFEYDGTNWILVGDWSADI